MIFGLIKSLDEDLSDTSSASLRLFLLELESGRIALNLPTLGGVRAGELFGEYTVSSQHSGPSSSPSGGSSADNELEKFDAVFLPSTVSFVMFGEWTTFVFFRSFARRFLNHTLNLIRIMIL